MAIKIPGLKIRPAAGGKTTWYWIASCLSRKSEGYEPRGAWLWHGVGEPSPQELENIENRACHLSIDFWEWLAGRRGKIRQRGVIYFVRAVDKVKIGFTRNVERRISELQTASPVNLELLGTLLGSLLTERKLHKRFSAHRVNREWFRYEPPIIGFVERECRKTKQQRASEPPVGITRSACRNHN